MVEAIAEWIW